MVQELQSNFIEEIKEGVTFVDFYADWCTPCRMMMPVVEALSEEYASKVKFLKVNVDENQEIAQNLNIQSIPRFFIFKDGNAVKVLVGAQKKDTLVAELEACLK
ncbi:thioredoxin [bacterium]|nr:thioredoxin [bacterium]